jgi:PKD repeat protein
MKTNHFQFFCGFMAMCVLLFTTSCKKNEVKPLPVPDFSYTGTSKVNETLSFVGTATNATSYEWSFGDGSVSYSQSTFHAYSSAGTFTVTLKAKGEGGEKAISKQVVITNNVPAPNADFIISSGNNQPAPTVVSFSNVSTNASSYDWDFGDGASSSSSSPSHVYSNAGTYSVILTARNSVGVQDTRTRTVYVTTPVVVPTQVRITQVRLVDMPFLDGTGAGWDPLDGPDVYFDITNQSSTILRDGENSHGNNLLPSQLPIQWTLSTPFVVSSLTSPRFFLFYDYDSADPNDYINYVGLAFSDLTSYPTSYQLTQNGITIRLTLEWF